MTIPPTGQQVSVEVVVVWRIANGKMVERWEVIDRLGMMQQLGVIPVMAQS